MTDRYDRGEFRGIYVALLDSPEFLDLSEEATSLLLPLKLLLGKAGIAVLYPELLQRYSKMDAARVADGLEQLTETGWIKRERNVVWLRNGLRFEPFSPLKVPNTRTSIINHLRSLPKLGIVRDFAAYYELPDPFADPAESEPKRKGSGRVREEMPQHGRRKTEDGERKTDSPPPLGAGAPEGSYLARAIEATNDAQRRHPAIDQDRLRAIAADHTPSAQTVAAWEAEGIPCDLALREIRRKVAEYDPATRGQITTLKYFDAPVREAFAAASTSRNGTNAHNPGGKPTPRAAGRRRRERFASE